jgi:hypothetical protein
MYTSRNKCSHNVSLNHPSTALNVMSKHLRVRQRAIRAGKLTAHSRCDAMLPTEPALVLRNDWPVCRLLLGSCKFVSVTGYKFSSILESIQRIPSSSPLKSDVANRRSYHGLRQGQDVVTTKKFKTLSLSRGRRQSNRQSLFQVMPPGHRQTDIMGGVSKLRQARGYAPRVSRTRRWGRTS